jgi:hypothetical protein
MGIIAVTAGWGTWRQGGGSLVGSGLICIVEWVSIGYIMDCYPVEPISISYLLLIFDGKTDR